MHRGFITLHRKTLDNPVVTKDGFHLAVWVYLLLNATHKEIQMLFNGRSIMLQPGQLITGRRSIAKKLRLNESRIQRILEFFKIEQLIEQQTNSQHRLITIVRWEQYQDVEQRFEQRANNERTTSEQRANTNNHITTEPHNNINNIAESENNISFSEPLPKIPQKPKRTRKKENTTVDEEFIQKMKEFYPGLNVEKELGKAKAWIEANKPRQFTRKFFNGWLSRSKPEKNTFDAMDFLRNL